MSKRLQVHRYGFPAGGRPRGGERSDARPGTTIWATGPSSEWFRALSGAGDRERFHFEGKTPYGLGSPRDIGRLLEKITRNEAPSRDSCAAMLRIFRGQQMNTHSQVPLPTADAARDARRAP